MTCREFKHNAASLRLQELSQTQDAQVLGHAQTCAVCAAWLGKQRALAASMHALQARTAGLEAGPDVERALLQAFRQTPRASIVAALCASADNELRPAPSGVKRTTEVLAAPDSTPLAWRLSRWFEIGAYVAAAAAIAVAIFLGVRLLPQGSRTAPAQGRSAPAAQPPAVAATGSAARPVASKGEQPKTAANKQPQRRTVREDHPATVAGAVAEQAASDADAGYVALMFCDPLSCSSESQVVRMELPVVDSAGQGAQTQLADVVVGYDGLVRAVRLVH